MNSDLVNGEIRSIDYGGGIVRLQALYPAFIWSAEPHDEMLTVFFNNPLGRWNRDKVMTYRDTNMHIAGFLGAPLIFHRKEVRVYPGDLETVEQWKEMMLLDLHFIDYVGQSGQRVEFGEQTFSPLPTPGNFSLYQREQQHRVDIVDQAKPIIDHIVVNELPCRRYVHERIFTSMELFLFGIEMDDKRYFDQREKFSKVRSLVIQIGALWVPSNDR